MRIIKTIIKNKITAFCKEIFKQFFHFSIFRRIFSRRQYNNVKIYFERSSLILNFASPFFRPYQLILITL